MGDRHTNLPGGDGGERRPGLGEAAATPLGSCRCGLYSGRAWATRPRARAPCCTAAAAPGLAARGGLLLGRLGRLRGGPGSGRICCHSWSLAAGDTLVEERLCHWGMSPSFPRGGRAHGMRISVTGICLAHLVLIWPWRVPYVMRWYTISRGVSDGNEELKQYKTKPKNLAWRDDKLFSQPKALPVRGVTGSSLGNLSICLHKSGRRASPWRLQNKTKIHFLKRGSWYQNSLLTRNKFSKYRRPSDTWRDSSTPRKASFGGRHEAAKNRRLPSPVCSVSGGGGIGFLSQNHNHVSLTSQSLPVNICMRLSLHECGKIYHHGRVRAERNKGGVTRACWSSGQGWGVWQSARLVYTAQYQS